MKRKIYNQLLDWKKQRNGKVAVMIDGATDYDWNRGGGLKRIIAITIERLRANVSDQHGFKTFYYGVGTVRTKKPS